MSDNDLAFASVAEIGHLFRKRQLSPLELTRFLLARIERLDPELNSYITVCGDLALKQARKAESELLSRSGTRGHRDRGPLHGIPLSLKDNINTSGVRTTAGAKFLKESVPAAEARVVAKLRQAGAVLLGKNNLHEFAYGVTSNNPHFGPVRNPWDLARIAGGSSGGSAAALASGLCYGSVGTDTGGSVRIPAALCGVAGLKPTRGRISVRGVVPLSTTLDTVGPLARSAGDLTLLARALFERADLSSGARSGKRKVRLGLPKEFFLTILSAPVRQSFEQALVRLERAGVTLVELSVPLLDQTEEAGNQIAWAEATLAHEQAGWFPARSADYGEDVRSRLEMGVKVSAIAYLKALALRAQFIERFHRALAESRVDALAVPTTPIPAPLIGQEKSLVDRVNHSTRALLLRLNRPANLAGVPAISLPCGRTAEGLPVGLQLVGAAGSDLPLLGIAVRFEKNQPELGHPPGARTGPVPFPSSGASHREPPEGSAGGNR